MALSLHARNLAFMMGTLCFCSASASAALADEIGFSALKAKYADLPTGTNLALLMGDFTSENTGWAWAVDPAGELAGKRIRYLPSWPKPKAYSPHSTGVITTIAGSSSGLLPGLPDITSIWSNDYGTLVLRLRQEGAPVPPKWDLEVHTWNWSDEEYSQELIRRMDWRVDQQGVTVVEALPNGRTATVPYVFTSGYNVITVGVTAGTHASGPTAIEVPGRTKPDLVAPTQYTSGATPVVAACAGLLIAKAKTDPALAQARDPRVVKALLLAGADKAPIPGWTHTTTQPLDPHYGAGQVNIANSYEILVVGRQLPGNAMRSATGWDRGGGGGSRYFFEVPRGYRATFSAALTWHRDVRPNSSWTQLPSELANLNLRLFSAAETHEPQSLVAESISRIDNVEHLYTTALSEGRYVLEVEGPKGTPYGIAWSSTLLPGSPAPETTATPSQPAAATSLLQSGMSAEQVQALVGPPQARKPFERQGIRAEIWSYTERRKLAERTVPLGYREAARTDSVTGSVNRVNEPIPGQEMTFAVEITDLLMIDSAIAQTKRRTEIVREVH